MIPGGAYEHSIKRFFAPVAALMDDPSVSEIMINGPDEIWTERSGKLEITTCSFESEDALLAALTNVAQFAGRHLGESHPILEAHLPDGSRLEAVLPPLADGGPVVAIRRFSRSTLTPTKLVEFGTLTRQAVAFLEAAVVKKMNIVVSGGTGSGKTSLLGVLSAFIPEGQRVVVIEDTREVQLQQSHVVYLETRSADERGRGLVTIRDLLRATLRLRPDRIVVGEVRGSEAIDLVQAMTSGHAGSLTTAHADRPLDMMRRLETMAMMDGMQLPLSAVRAQTASAVDLVVQINRAHDGSRKVSEITRVLGTSDDGEYRTRQIFRGVEGKGLVYMKKRKGGIDET